jgi:hypothetical protein
MVQSASPCPLPAAQARPCHDRESFFAEHTLVGRLTPYLTEAATFQCPRFDIRKEALTHEECFGRSGLLPLFLWLGWRQAQAGGTALKLALWPDKDALIDYLPYIPESDDETAWRDVLAQLLQGFSGSVDPAGAVSLDAVYAQFQQALAQHEIQVLTNPEALNTFMAEPGPVPLELDLDDLYSVEQPTGKKPETVQKFFPKVTRPQIADWLVANVARQARELKAANTRPLAIFVEHPFDSFALDIARAFCPAAGAEPFFATLADGDDVCIPASKLAELDPEYVVDQLSLGRMVYLVGGRLRKLRSELRELVDLTLEIPRFDADTLGACCTALFGLTAPAEVVEAPWVALVRPQDFLANSAAQGDVLDAIRESVERRLALVSSEGGMALGELHGLGEAKDWALQVMDDMRLAALGPERGGISWDEVDAIGSRDKLTGDSRQYQLEVIDALLQELDGFHARDRVLVLAATNHASDVDPALCRAGRLDRIIQIPYPSSHALAKIYGHYLKDVRSSLSDGDVADMGRSSLGLTGADVELVVRTAKRVACKDGLRPVAKDDLLRAVFRTPSAENRGAIRPEQLACLAYHEAGHSLAQLLGQSRGEAILYVSVIPRNDGTAGFVASFVSEDALLFVREDLLERIRTVLAGRAAEEVVFGKDRITSGSGGTDPKCDLAVATRTAQTLLTKYGFADHGSLVWQATSGDGDPRMTAALHELLEQQYALVKTQFEANRSMLDQLAQALLQHQELRGDAVRELFRLHAGKAEISA